jgi:hypothetical protein
LLIQQKKQKVANGGQVGGQIVVSKIRRVSGKLLTFWMKWIKLTHQMKTFRR